MIHCACLIVQCGHYCMQIVIGLAVEMEANCSFDEFHSCALSFLFVALWISSRADIWQHDQMWDMNLPQTPLPHKRQRCCRDNTTARGKAVTYSYYILTEWAATHSSCQRHPSYINESLHALSTCTPRMHHYSPPPRTPHALHACTTYAELEQVGAHTHHVMAVCPATSFGMTDKQVEDWWFISSYKLRTMYVIPLERQDESESEWDWMEY